MDSFWTFALDAKSSWLLMGDRPRALPDGEVAIDAMSQPAAYLPKSRSKGTMLLIFSDESTESDRPTSSLWIFTPTSKTPCLLTGRSAAHLGQQEHAFDGHSLSRIETNGSRYLPMGRRTDSTMQKKPSNMLSGMCAILATGVAAWSCLLSPDGHSRIFLKASQSATLARAPLATKGIEAVDGEYASPHCQKKAEMEERGEEHAFPIRCFPPISDSQAPYEEQRRNTGSSALRLSTLSKLPRHAE